MLTQRRKPQSTSLLGRTGTMSPDFASDLCSLPSGPHGLSLEQPPPLQIPSPVPGCPTEPSARTPHTDGYSLLIALDPARSLAPTVPTLCPLHVQLLIAETICSR